MSNLSGVKFHCSANDSFDSVALMLYGHEKYAVDLMTENPEYCGMTVFDGGEMLHLPIIDIPEDDDEAALAMSTIAPWKEG